jgi:hypothetical protein
VEYPKSISWRRRRSGDNRARPDLVSRCGLKGVPALFQTLRFLQHLFGSPSAPIHHVLPHLGVPLQDLARAVEEEHLAMSCRFLSFGDARPSLMDEKRRDAFYISVLVTTPSSAQRLGQWRSQEREIRLEIRLRPCLHFRRRFTLYHCIRRSNGLI